MGSLVKMFETWSWRFRLRLTDAAHLSNDISHSVTFGILPSSCTISKQVSEIYHKTSSILHLSIDK